MSSLDREHPRASSPLGPVALGWICALIVLWTSAWLLLDVVSAKWQVVGPMLLIVLGMVVTVGFGRTLGAHGARRRVRRFAAAATAILTLWSYAALVVTLIVHHTGFADVVSTVIFGSFVAVLLALVCFCTLAILLWIGTRVGVTRRSAAYEPSSGRSERRFEQRDAEWDEINR